MMNFIRRAVLLTTAVALFSTSTGCSKAARAERRLNKADQYFSQGKYLEAEIEYLNVLQLNDQNSHAIARLGTIYYEGGRTSRAFAFINRASELLPDDPDIKLKAGLIRLAAGDFTNAAAMAAAVLQKSPTNSEAPLLLVEAARTTNELIAARQTLQKLQSQVGDTAPVSAARGALAIRLGDTRTFESQLRKAIATDPNFSPALAALATWHWSQKDLTNARSEFQRSAQSAPVRSVFRLRYADFQIKTGQIDAGRAALTEMTEKAPDYLPAWLSLAELALSQNQLTNCSTLVSRAISLAPEDLNAHLLRARLHIAQRDGDKAVAELEKLSTALPKSPQLHFLLAHARLLKNEEAKALRSLGQAITLAPDYYEALLLQAQINLRRDNPDAAISSLTDLVRRRPELPQAHLLLISAYLKKNDPNSALRQCEALRKAFPEHPEVPLLTGTIQLEQKNNAEARRQFERAIELAPDAVAPFEQLINLDINEKAYDRAVSRVQARMTQWPQSPVLPMILGRIYWAQGETNKAEASFQQAIQLEPGFGAPYLQLARLYVQSQQVGKAVDQLKRAVESNNRDLAALMLLGQIQSEQGDFKASRDTYETLLAINPRFAPALNNVAYLYSEKLNQLDKAYDAARRARDQAPRDPFSADTLGWVLFKRGEYNWALNLLQESAESLGSEPEVQFHLGMTYYMLNESARAQAAFSRALASDKDFPGKAEATQRLATLRIDSATAEPKLITDLEKRVAEQPADVIALAKLGALYEKSGAAEKAAGVYERALKQSPESTSLMITLSELYSGPLRTPEKALQLLKQAYKATPDNPETTYALARQVYAARDHQWALSLLQQAAPSMPQNPRFHYDLALAQLSAGRIEDAELSFRRSLELDSKLPEAAKVKTYLELIAVLRSPDKAAQSGGRVRELAKADPDGAAALAATALVQERSGDAAAAIITNERILSLYPLFTPATKQLAALYAKDPANTQKAYDHAVKARSAFPDDPEVAKTLGILSYRRNDFSRSAQLLKEASLKRPNDAETLFHLGMAQQQLKQSAEAQKSLREALALNLDPALADQARKALQEVK